MEGEASISSSLRHLVDRLEEEESSWVTQGVLVDSE